VSCSVEGKSKVAERLKAAEAAKETTATTTASSETQKQDTVVATQLGGDASGAAGAGCGCAGAAPAAADSGCGCSNGVSYVSSVGGGSGGDFSSWKDMHEKEIANLGPRPKVEEAVRPIDDWLNDFAKRTNLQGGLWEAARATVQPLLKRLERTQHEAIERLKDSNKAIRNHVEDAATEHIYNLLRSKRALDDAELAAEEKKHAVGDADKILKRAQEQKKEAQESAKAMQDNFKKEKELEAKNGKKGNTTDTIMSHISKILAEK